MIQVEILTISDRSFRGEREDASGPVIRDWALEKGYSAGEIRIVPDDCEAIKNTLRELCETGADLLFTTGGTGFAPRDITPEATRSVIEREAPGISETIRLRSLEITEHAMLSRAVSGIRGKTLIVNLPGSPKAVRESLTFIEKALPHAVELLNSNVSDCGTS